jgi:hypothetical protein
MVAMPHRESIDEMLSEVKEYEALNNKVKDALLRVQGRKVELRDRFEASRKKWQAVEHSRTKQEECLTLLNSTGSVLKELRELEAATTGPRKELVDSLQKIPKRKVSKWRPVLAELNTENEKYFREAIPALVQMVNRYEASIDELEQFVNSDT